jgi:hypothetical protein
LVASLTWLLLVGRAKYKAKAAKYERHISLAFVFFTSIYSFPLGFLRLAYSLLFHVVCEVNSSMLTAVHA